MADFAASSRCLEYERSRRCYLDYAAFEALDDHDLARQRVVTVEVAYRIVETALLELIELAVQRA